MQIYNVIIIGHKTPMLGIFIENRFKLVEREHSIYFDMDVISTS